MGACSDVASAEIEPVRYLPYGAFLRVGLGAGLGILFSSLGVGCADTDLRPPPDVVFAVLEPTTSPPRVPLPNDLIGIPASATSPAATTFSGPLAPASV